MPRRKHAIVFYHEETCIPAKVVTGFESRELAETAGDALRGRHGLYTVVEELRVNWMSLGQEEAA